MMLRILAMLVALPILFPIGAAGALPPGGTFFDDDGSVHEGAIEAVAAAGLTVGCDELGERFCPDRVVTRAEMATFLVRALGLDPLLPERFTDAAGVHERSIGAVEAAGLFKGCNPPANDQFCPDDPLTRGQAAAVLVRAFDVPDVAGSSFTDIDGSVFADAIESLAAAGVTKGCNPPDNDRFCPNRVLSRAEMATLLTRLMGLTPNKPDPAFDGHIVLGLHAGAVWYGGIATMEGTRVPRTVVNDTVGNPRLSPDGEMIAYIDIRRACPPVTEGWWDCYSRLFTMPFGGAAEIQMTPDETEFNGSSWLPDGRSLGLAVALDLDDDGEQSEWQLATISTPLVLEELGARSSRALLSPEWSTQGDIVAIAQFEFGNTVLMVFSAEGHPLEIIASAGRDLLEPAWSPDGTKLAYVSVGEAEDQLIVSAPDGGSRQVLTSEDNIRQVSWSPHGDRLAYVVEDATSGDRRIFVNDLDGTERLLVPGTPDVWDYAWSPDGAAIAYTQDLRVWAIPADGGEAWPLVPSDWRVIDLDWGPSG